MNLALAIRGHRAMTDGSGRRIRESARLPLRYFATELGVTPSTISCWERGEQSATPEHAAAYAELLERIASLLEPA